MPQSLPLHNFPVCVAAQVVWYLKLLASEASSVASSRPGEAGAALCEALLWALLTLDRPTSLGTARELHGKVFSMSKRV